ncbi:hypothetical protein BGZ99_006419 [Dissophora globulifera]|uniref:Centromere protein X n=1 Tax=Dissophora globulifera TaxID=979702 RepID=A0A9P6RGG8_9FUNG|nr:hypothetical protein BGZ99_006419 [Dissophora globulifera]
MDDSIDLDSDSGQEYTTTAQQRRQRLQKQPAKRSAARVQQGRGDVELEDEMDDMQDGDWERESRAARDKTRGGTSSHTVTTTSGGSGSGSGSRSNKPGSKAGASVTASSLFKGLRRAREDDDDDDEDDDDNEERDDNDEDEEDDVVIEGEGQEDDRAENEVTFRPATMHAIFKGVWTDSGTKVHKEALELSAEYLRLFTIEALHRTAAYQREQEDEELKDDETLIELDSLEAITPQLVMDF